MCIRAWLVAVVACIGAAPAQAQVLVESVAPSWAAAPTGIAAGDRLVSWERPRKDGVVITGTFNDPFDVREFEVEQLPRGTTRVRLIRGTRPMTVSVVSPDWGVTTGLWLQDEPRRQRFERGLARANAHDIEGALASWQPLAVDLAMNRRWRAAAWLRCRIGSLLVEPVGIGADRWPKPWVEGKGVNDSDAAFAEAGRLARLTKDPGLEAMAYEAGGRAWAEDSPVSSPGRMSFGRCRKLFIHAGDIRRRVAPGSLLLAASLQSLGLLWAYNDDPAVPPDVPKGRVLCREALAIRQRLVPASYDEALARAALQKIDDPTLPRSPAERIARVKNSRETVRLLQRTPGSIETLALAAVEAAYTSVGFNDFAGAVRLRRIELPLVERLEEATLAGQWRPPAACGPCIDLYVDLNNFSVELAALGRADEAEAAAERSLRVAERRGEKPEAWTFDNLATAAGMRGDYPAQQKHLLHGLELRRAEGDPRRMVHIYIELGLSARSVASAVFLRQALSIADTITPPATEADRAELGGEVCDGLVALAERGEATAAESTRLDAQCGDWGQVTDATLRGDPNGYHLMNLSRVALARGDQTRALALAAEAVRVNRTPATLSAPLPFGLGNALLHLGRAQCAAGDGDHGVASLAEARRIFERVAPRSDSYLEALDALGRCERARGHPRQGAALLERVLGLVDAMPEGRTTSTLGRTANAATWAGTSAGLAGALVDSHQFAAAFDALERGRARAFRAALAERGLARPAIAPAQAARRSALWLRYDATQKTLEQLPAPASRSETSRLLADLALVSAQMDGLDSEIRRTTPPRALGGAPTLEQVTQTLPAGTLLLEYSVEADRTQLFIVEPGTIKGTIQVLTLRIAARELAAAVSAFRHVLERRATASLPEVQQRGTALYDILIRPAERVIDKASRLVVVPDGPLYDLPFAALVRSGPRPSYLIESLPVVVAASAGTFTLLARLPPAAVRGSVVAVGDTIQPPTSDERPPANAALRGEAVAAATEQSHSDGDDEDDERGGGGLSALPGTRREVESIARLFGPGVVTLLGHDATETKVKALPPTTRILHFATHAVVNNVMPLNAGLRLTPPDGKAVDASATSGSDNGLLQAWEIIEQMHVDADLVTLSACESARGRTLAGEGALSLARAFHYAGARSVVSALWSIDDNATAALMTAFYAGLKEGLGKDEALRHAQVAFIKRSGGDSRWVAPAYWAAFELSGDWR